MSDASEGKLTPVPSQEITPAVPEPAGLFSVVKSAFGLQLQSKTLRREAERNRAGTDVIDSLTELTKSAVTYRRALTEWEDVDNIVKDDQQARDHDRWQSIGIES